MNEKDVLKNRALIFKDLLGNVIRCIDESKIEDALVYLKIAAQFAAESHMGEFYNSKIEDLMKQISKIIFTSEIEYKPLKNYSGKENVLHIASYITEVGGHTRLLLNWVSGDSLYENHILLTECLHHNYPWNLLDTYDYKFRIINTGLYNSIEKIKKIREMAKKYNYIVLHIHPEDILTYIALVDLDIPIVFMNHADHRFWVGRDISNLFLEIREEGAKTSNSRRAIPKSHQELFPIPLKMPILKTKEQARLNLNIDQEKMVILSIASSFKYQIKNNVGLTDVLIKVANEFDNIEFIIIGPTEQEQGWEYITEKLQGKISVLGEVTEVDDYYLAADIYLDSYPVSSLTSLLDAAKYGLALISVHKEHDTLNVQDISLDDKFKVYSLEELSNTLIKIINNREELLSRQTVYKNQVYKDHLIKYAPSKITKIFERAAKNELLKSCEVESKFTELDKGLAYMYTNEENPRIEIIKLWEKYFNLFSDIEKLVFIEYLNKKDSN